MQVCRDRGGNEENGVRKVEEGGLTGQEEKKQHREKKEYLGKNRLKEGSNRGKREGHAPQCSYPSRF